MKYSILLITALLSADTIYVNNKGDSSLTIYSNGYSLVEEKQKIRIPSNGNHKIIIEEIPSEIIRDSFKLKSDSLNVLSQSYNLDVFSFKSLLEKNIGKQIEYIEESNWEKGTLLSIEPIMIKTINNQIITLDSPTQLKFSKTPDDLLLKPSLTINGKGEKGISNADIMYLTNGLNWGANYIVNIDGSNLDIDGSINIINNSGKDFEKTTISCVAGKVNKIQPQQKMIHAVMSRESDVVQINKNEIGSNYIYTIERKESLKNKEEKEFSFLNVKDVNFKNYIEESEIVQFYKYNEKELNLKNILEMKSSIEMPEGKWRIFEKVDSKSKFIGENYLSNKSDGEDIKIELGSDYNIKGVESVIETYSNKEESFLNSNILLSNYGNKEKEIRIKRFINNGEVKDNCSGFCEKIKEDGYVLYIINLKGKETFKLNYSIKIKK